MVDYDFDIALLSTKEATHILVMADEGCVVCKWISTKALFKNDDDWFVNIEHLEDSDIEHLEKLIDRKLGDGMHDRIYDQIVVAERYTSNQF